MNIVARLRIFPHRLQHEALLDTMSDYNAACNYISEYAVGTNTYGQYDLHHACYKDTRSEFPSLTANHVVRAIARVSQSYKTLNKNERKAYAKFKNGEADRWYRDQRSFKWRNGMELDDKLWAFLKDDTLSISTIRGRAKGIVWDCNEHNLNLMRYHSNSATLVYRNGKFFLHVVCRVNEKPLHQPDDYIGVDLGVVNIAVTSDGNVWNGERIETKRQWYAWRKAQLQRVGTDSAKRRLVKLSGRENRFKRDVDHCISKHIVTDAEHTGRGIALENLEGIHERTRAIRKEQRAKHHNWSFYRLQQHVVYKAKLSGVEVAFINAAHTSQDCSQCGHRDKRNRKSQSRFVCVSCNYTQHADLNAALNIRNRAIQQA